MPRAQRKSVPELNLAYAFVASNNFAESLSRLKDSLLENGFQRQGVDEMIAPLPVADLGPLFSSRATGGETIAVEVSEAPGFYLIPEELAQAVRFDVRTQTIELPANLTSAQVAAIAPAFATASARQAFIWAVQTRQACRYLARITPSQRGETFSVPLLAWRQGRLLEPFQETHFLNFHWELSKKGAALSELEFPAGRPALQQAEADISDKGKIRTEFIANLQSQTTILKVEQGWKVSDLVYWLDRNILHRDITAIDAGVFLTRLVINLIEKRGLSIDALVREKYRLMDAAAAKIDFHRKSAHATSFHQLLGDDSPIEVTP